MLPISNSGNVLGLESLSNIKITTPSSGQTLTYNGTTKLWNNSVLVIPNGSLSTLNDVLLNSISDTQVLTFNIGSQKWTNQNIPNQPKSISVLTDVALSGLTDNNILLYNNSAGKWANAAIPNQPKALATLTDVNVSGIPSTASNYTLYYDGPGAVWRFRLPALGSSYLSDVIISSPAANNALLFNGTSWVNSAIPAQSISTLSDTTITSPANNNLLTYSGGKWINKTATLTSSLSDIAISSVTDLQVLTYNAGTTKWVNKTPSLASSGLSDVAISSPSDQQILVYSAATSKWQNTTASGTYYGSTTTGTNVTSGSSMIFFWTRIGNIVTGTFNSSIVVTNGLIATNVTVSLPPSLAPTFGNQFWANGPVTFYPAQGTGPFSFAIGYINASSGGNTLTMQFSPCGGMGSVTGQLAASFQYRMV